MVPFQPQIPIWKGRHLSELFCMSSFPSNHVVSVTVSDSAAPSMWLHTVQRWGNLHITLSLLLQLMGECGKCWSKTEWPKTGAHNQLLRDLQETGPKGLHCSTQVLGALVLCLCFLSMSFSKTGWNFIVYFRAYQTHRKKNCQNESHEQFIASLLTFHKRLSFT